MCRNFKWSFFQGSQWKNNVNKINFTFYKEFGKYFFLVPRDFFQNFGLPISQGSLWQLSRWVFLGQYYPLKGPICIKNPRIFKTIKLFCTNDRLQLIITFLESITIHQNQSKMVKWTSRYCPILKLLETREDFAFHKHNYHCVQRADF